MLSVTFHERIDRRYSSRNIVQFRPFHHKAASRLIRRNTKANIFRYGCMLKSSYLIWPNARKYKDTFSYFKTFACDFELVQLKFNFYLKSNRLVSQLSAKFMSFL